MSGKGKKTMANGDMFEGEWSEDKAEGYGTKTFAVAIIIKEILFVTSATAMAHV